jgi:hypothetical protein
MHALASSSMADLRTALIPVALTRITHCRYDRPVSR